ncbi:HAMP domain-containing sensor histidine kinase [Kitasatospora paracochleata]|uniref:histidine kinase n=1 Tax=Kitasatospora paracochleata TaxID=58354 RepID=A0ABT1ITQ6_9ACTN|nr:HAMP domain-containing sensor histidine kinase [Kitasatospora paracochleata]MCP2307976.1 two-component system OmpR family sensor kinase [Kitasatospora paracochleata]
MRRPRIRLLARLPRTLRARLIAGLLVLLALVFTGIGVATTTALRHFLAGQVDERLQSAGGRYAASLEHPGAGGADSRGQAPGTFAARLVNGTVTQAAVVAGIPPGDDDPVPTADTGDDLAHLSTRDRDRLAGLAAGAAPRTVQLSGLGNYRVAAVAGRDGDVLVTGLPLHPVDETVQRLGAIEALVFAVGLTVAGTAGALWVRISLRPLERVADAADRVGALPLASGAVALPVRVPDDDPRTEVGRVGLALNRMLGHVEDALTRRQNVEERLRAFAADASHELRTPVAAVRGHAELALRHPGPVPEPVRHSLRRIDAESQRMGAIVEDLLLLARLDAGRPLAVAEVDLTRVALDGLTDARAAGPGHRWRLELPEDPVLVAGDADRLAQVVANLLANARTHTPEGTEVTLRLERLAGRTALSVADTGPGIEPELAERVFERFVRGDRARSRRTGSTGLGLAIVRAVVAAHGGTVAVSSRPGRTVFTVVLPDPAAGGNGSGPDPASATRTGPETASAARSGPEGPSRAAAPDPAQEVTSPRAPGPRPAP